MADTEVTDQARNNTFDNFRLVFDPRFLDTIVSRMDDNEAIYKRLLDDGEFREAVRDFFATRIYRRAREGEEGKR